MRKSLLLLLTLFAGPVLAAVNLNTATQAELESVTGIGPSRAKAIVEYRKANGPFKKVDDLVNLPGIGPKSMDQLRPQLSIGAAGGNAPAAAPMSAKAPSAASAARK